MKKNKVQSYNNDYEFNNLPLVSIIIPVYNGSNFVSEAIDSALRQSYPNIEVIVVNDGSIDNGKTRKIALSYGNKIRYLEKKNGGVSSALNLGISEMRGDYFSWLSHDDLYHHDNILLQIKNIISDGGNFVSACSTCAFSDYVPTISKFSEKRVRVLKSPLDHFRYWLYGCSLLIPKDILNTVKGLNERNHTTQDVELVWELLRIAEIRMLNTKLVFRRVHSDQGYQNPNIILINVRESSCLLKYKINNYGIEYFAGDNSSNFRKACIFVYLASKYAADRRLISIEGMGLVEWLINSADEVHPFIFSPFRALKKIPIKYFVAIFSSISFSRKLLGRVKRKLVFYN